MRLMILFLLLCAICFQGCCSCKNINDFGQCLECKQCTRSNVPSDWKLVVQEIRPFECSPIERTDLIFPWEEIYGLLFEHRKLYLERLQDCSKWCTGYSKCNVSENAWKSYWKELFNAAIRSTRFKEAMVKRIGAILSNDSMDINRRGVLHDMVRHLDTDLSVYHEHLLKMSKRIDLKNLVDEATKTELTKSHEDLKKAVSDANVRMGSITCEGEQMIAQLKTEIANVKKIPRKE